MTSGQVIKRKQIDFISELPSDIVGECIVPRIVGYDGGHFQLHGRRNYFAVCKTWSKRIAENDDNIHFDIESHRLLSHRDWMRVQAVAPYIKTITVHAMTEINLSNLIRYTQFSSLHDLRIKVKGFQQVWMQLLRSIPSLRCLHITFEAPGSQLQLCDMLNQCPGCIQLKLTMVSGSRLTSATCHNSIYPNIRHLEVIYRRRHRSMNTQLCQHFPGLRLLRLSHLPPTQQDDLHMIFRHCPMLQQLLLGNQSYVSDIENYMIQQGDSQGLRVISLRDVPLHGDAIADLMRRHYETLEAFELQGYFRSSAPVDMLANDPVEFNQLRSLRFPHEMGVHVIDLLRWIISRAPYIEYVESLGGRCTQGEILDALMSRPVRSIHLECSAFSSELSARRFLNHHEQLSTASSLQEVACTIINPCGMSGDWVFSISKLQQLKSLELSLSSGGREDLMEILILFVTRGCNSLEKVTLTFPTLLMPVESVLPLSEHPHLKSLIIVSGSIPNDALQALECFWHLDVLHLKLKTFDWNAIARLKSRILGLTCTVVNDNP